MKYFLSKHAPLTEQRLSMLKDQFTLSEEDMINIESWEDMFAPSAFGGIVIDTDENAQYRCWPYDRDEASFIERFPEGEILSFDDSVD